MLAAIVHNRQPNPHLLDRIFPTLDAVIMFGLSFYLWRSPQQILRVIWIALLTFVAAMAVPAWYFTIATWRGVYPSLVDILPPISSLLILPLFVLTIVVRPRYHVYIATGIWLLVALPILSFLLLHPRELASPRGLDIFLTIGPVALSLVAFIPFQRSIDLLITKLQNDRMHAQGLADRDVLTGLYNRRAGERMLEDVLASPKLNDVLILFDLDHFKAINDTHGHPTGDTVLQEVAKRCAALLRKSDVFARWGGEEFLILIRDMDESGVLRVANDLRRAIAATPIEAVGTVTASFGFSHYQHKDTLLSWVMRADGALYEAKSSGRDQVVRR